jgi:hypothetical protein
MRNIILILLISFSSCKFMVDKDGDVDIEINPSSVEEELVKDLLIL